MAARHLERMADRLPHALSRATEEQAREVEAKAREYSSGTVSSAQLRAEDHPYARRHGNPQRRPDLINRQSGQFVSAWAHDPAEAEGDEISSSVFNVAPHARYLFDLDASDFPDGGTERMFGRPVPERVASELEPEYAARIEAATESLWEG